MMTPDEIRKAFDMKKFPFIDQYMKGYSAFEVHASTMNLKFEVHVGQDNIFGPEKIATIALVEPLSNKACYLHAIETIPEKRKCGLAGMIINDLKERYDMIYLNAVPELDFYYKRYGFNELQIGGGYYVWMRNPK